MKRPSSTCHTNHLSSHHPLLPTTSPRSHLHVLNVNVRLIQVGNGHASLRRKLRDEIGVFLVDAFAWLRLVADVVAHIIHLLLLLLLQGCRRGRA